MTALTDLFDQYNAGELDPNDLEDSLVDFDYDPVMRPAEYLWEEDPTDQTAAQFVYPQENTTQEVEDAGYTAQIPPDIADRVMARLRGGDLPKVLAPSGAKSISHEAASARTRKAWLSRRRAAPHLGVSAPASRTSPLTDKQVALRKARYERLVNGAEWGTGGPHDTMTQHSKVVTLRNGSQARVWDPERRRVHEKMLSQAMRDAVNRGVPAEHKALMLGGLGGAGKSALLANKGADFGVDLGDPPDPDRPQSHIVVNPDLFKMELMDKGLVDTMPGLTPMESAHLAHEESSYLADRLRERASAAGLNIILDGTMSNADSATRKAQLLEQDGYTVDGVFVDVSTAKSKASATARYGRGLNAYLHGGSGLGGRPVPDSFIDNSAAPAGSMVPGPGGKKTQARSKNRVVFHELAAKGVFDKAMVFDNEGDGTSGSYPNTLVWSNTSPADK